MIFSAAILLAYISLFVLGLGDNVRGPIYPEMIQAFAISHSTGSFYFTVASAMSFLGSISAPAVIRKWGRLRSLQFSIMLFVIAEILMFSSSQFSILLAGALFFGWSLGLMGVVQNVLVISRAPSHRLQQFQSGLHSMYGASSLLAPLMVSVMVTMTSSWRSPFLICALGALVLLVCSLWTSTTSLEGTFESNSSLEEVSPGERSQNWKDNFPIWSYAWILAAYVAAEIMIGSRLASVLRSELAWDLNQSSLATTAFFAGLFVGRVLFIFWRPPLSLKTQMLCSLGGSIALIALGLIWRPEILILAGLTMAPFYPLSMTAAGSLFPRSLNQAMSAALAMTGVSVVTMHWTVGILTDVSGLRGALWVGTLFLASSFLLLFFYQKIFDRKVGG